MGSGESTGVPKGDADDEPHPAMEAHAEALTDRLEPCFFSCVFDMCLIVYVFSELLVHCAYAC